VGRIRPRTGAALGRRAGAQVADSVLGRWDTAGISAVREELHRLTTFEERHRRLFARLLLVVLATALIDICATVAMFFLERDAHATEVKTFGRAIFFSTVQLLTVSSQMKNPVTPGGRGVDVFLELWAVVVVAGSAGAVAAFFQNGDSSG
jgi:hypothetical protein